MNIQTLSVATPSDVIQNWLISNIAEQFELDSQAIDVQKPLTQYGLDSIIAFTVVGELEEWFEVELPATLLWDYPTIEQATNYLVTLGLTENNTNREGVRF